MVVKHQQGKLVDKKYLFYFTEGEIEMRNDWNIIFRKFPATKWQENEGLFSGFSF